MNLTTVYVKHERRIRLIFSDQLQAGAFVTSLYTVESVDGASGNPQVQLAMVVPSSPNVVELQLSLDLASGGRYRAYAGNVPGATGNTPADEYTDFFVGVRDTNTRQIAVTPAVSEDDKLAFGVDMAWTGTDWAETPNGDLDTVAGLQCLKDDLAHRIGSNGLPWDTSFGLKPREYLDAPVVALPPLRGQVVTEVQKDDRVRRSEATLATDNTGTTVIVVTVVPVVGTDELKLSLNPGE